MSRQLDTLWPGEATSTEANAGFRPPRFSLVVPAYDEEENVGPLLDEIAATLARHGPFEVILVDDRSTDATVECARAWRERRAAGWLRIVSANERGGQSSAVMTGVELARSEIVATMDSDLQNDPHDVIGMIESIERGECDAAFGVRVKRDDAWIRRVSSRVGNGVRDWITGDRVRDAACGIKAMRRDLFLHVPRFDGMHRFMVTLVRYCGGRVREVPVSHRPRVAGRSKYGVTDRAFRGLVDCLGVCWLRRRVVGYRATELEADPSR